MNTHQETNPCPAPAKSRKPRRRNLRWASLVGTFDAGDCQVVPLVCSDDLREEGELMNHCVGKRYHRWCHDGAVRVFSIRDLLGRRVATASLYYDFGMECWRVEQYKGYGNQEVGVTAPSADNDISLGGDLSDIHFVVEQLAVLYQQAQEIEDARMRQP